MAVEVATAGHRAFASDIESRKCIHLPGIWNANDHAELLMHVGVGSGRFHATKFEWRPFILVEIREDFRGLHGLLWETKLCSRTHCARRFRNRRAIFRDEHTGKAVI